MFENLPKEILLLLVAFFGAIVHATAQLKVARDDKKEYTSTDFLINFVIAIGAGVMFGFVARIFFVNMDVIMLFTSVGTFLGISGMNSLSVAVLQMALTKLKK